MKRDTNETTGKENTTPADQEEQSYTGTSTPHVDETNVPPGTNPPDATETGTVPPETPAALEQETATNTLEVPATQSEVVPAEGATGHLYEQKESGGFDADAEKEAAKPHIKSKEKNWDDGSRSGGEFPRSR